MSGVLWQESSGFWHYLFDGQLGGVSPTDPRIDDNDSTPLTLGHVTHARLAHIPDPNNKVYNWYAASCRKALAYEVCPPEVTDIANNPIETDRKVWRPSLPSRYIEPDPGPDLLDGMELIFKDYGKSLRKATAEIPARADILYFNEERHAEELRKNIRWSDCPEEHRATFENLIHKYWDVFAEEGLRRPILGYECRVDTGDVSPVCCKPPRYGPHESKIMGDLVEKLLDNGLVEPDDGPWGALIVLAPKAQHRDHTPWHEYDWRLCVSYRKLNQVTRPFTFPIPRCDDAVMDLPADAKFRILTDMFSGYWQIVVEKGSRPKLAFFTPDGKVRWTVMPMGALNSHAIFVAMMTDLSGEVEC